MNPTTQQAILYSIVFVILIIVLILLEQKYFLRKNNHALLPRLLINSSLSVLSFVTVYFLIFPVQTKTLEFTAANNFGLVKLIQLPKVLKALISFLLMDLAFYYWHLLNHKVPFLWRFHNVHHLDPDLDVSTAFRFHFVEIGLSTVFRVLQISIIGISPIAFMIYELCFTVNTIFQHSNIRLPIMFERVLNKIIVTPRMHGIHHSNFKEETNSNYSTVFSCWDRLHKTMQLNIPQSKIKIGVPGYSDKSDHKLVNAFICPFISQKNYWELSGKKYYRRDENINSQKTFLEE
jgi:sterol desaturase/sphingolipid hydroxylase (fatty acid hydroxylase superfamily)